MIYNENLNVLERQVLELTEAVQTHWNVDRVLTDFGIKIMGSRASTDLLPDVPPGGAEAYGEAYAIGENPPYQFWIWTRPGDWFNIGELAIEGQKGVPGASIIEASYNDNNELVLKRSDGIIITVPGSMKGETGASPSITKTSITGGVRITINNPEGSPISSFDIMNGADGASIQGPPGPPSTWNLQGLVSLENQLPAIETVPDGTAYLVGNNTAGYHLYVYFHDASINAQIRVDTGPVAAGTYVFVDGQPSNSVDMNNYVAKATSGSGRRVYAISASNSPETYVLRPDVVASPNYQIVVRDSRGHITLPSNLPINNTDATSKLYVDNAIRNALTSGITLYNNLVSIITENGTHAIFQYMSKTADSSSLNMEIASVWYPCSGYCENDTTVFPCGIQRAGTYELNILLSNGETEYIEDYSMLPYLGITPTALL